MLYKFTKDCETGTCRVKNIHIAWYDMDRNGDCFDEDFEELTPDQEKLLAYVETQEDKNNIDNSRVFINMDNGDCYELIMKKVSSRCSNFYDD